MTSLFQVDAFTDTPFHGNPAAVCLLEEERDMEWMQEVAAEMNLSETAFVRPLEEGYELRWFTPSTEVNLCGHATLATAHILWRTGRLPADIDAHFHTRSGLLTCKRRASGIEMTFPADPTVPLQQDALSADILETPFVSAHRGREDWLVELESEQAVLSCRPNLAGIATLPVRGLMITARGNGDNDFVSRFFAPGAGIDEDPVTGSAHCTLARYWSERLGKTTMQAWQASPRGGNLEVTVKGDNVLLTGNAVTVFSGELTA